MSTRWTPGPVAIAIAVSSVGIALIQLDVTIVNVALPRIAEDLGASTAALQWVVDAYALSFAVLLLSGGVLGDRFGARRLYGGGMALFCVASALCGLASSMSGLVAARVLQGVGAAAMLPNSLALLNHACAHEPRLRAKAVGWWTAAGAIAIASGPLVAGLLLGAGSWRGIFLINLPLCLAGLLLTRRIDETERAPGASRSMDWAGQALSILAMSGLVGAVIEARPLGLAHPLVLVGVGLFLVAAPLFVVVERQSAAPMLPPHVFVRRSFGVAVTYGAVCNFTYYGVLFVLSLYLQRVLGYGATEAGLAYLPLTATFVAVNVFSGWLVGRVGWRWPMVAGALVDATGFALLLGLGASSPYALMLAPFALMPGGMGTGVPAMTIMVLAGVGKGEAGIASAGLNAARQCAGALGVAVFGALLGEAPDDIVGGLHAAALVSVGLLVLVAGLAWWGTREARA